jgi:hypothetical protein
LIVKNATGKAAACGVRHLDLVCSINDKVVSKQEALSLSDATPCSRLVIKRHSLPCAHVTRSIPAGSGIYDIGLSLKAQTHTRASDPSAITTQYIVDASLSSDYAVEPGDWVRTVGGLLLFNKSPEQVKKIMSGERASVVEVCWWSADVRLEDISSGTLTSSAVLPLSAAAVLIFSFLALRQTPKGEKEGGGDGIAKIPGHGNHEVSGEGGDRKFHAHSHTEKNTCSEQQPPVSWRNDRAPSPSDGCQPGSVSDNPQYSPAQQPNWPAQHYRNPPFQEPHQMPPLKKTGGEPHRLKAVQTGGEPHRPKAGLDGTYTGGEPHRLKAVQTGGEPHRPKAGLDGTYTGGELHHLEAVPTGGGGDCLFHALVGALQDFSHRRQHSDYLRANGICLPHTHQEMRHVVVSFASDCRRMDDMFIDSGHSFTLEQAVDTDCRSHRGNNVVHGSEGNVVFHNVDEYFQVRCCFALVLISVSKATPDFQIMRRDGSWGQHYEVMAAAALFQVCIEVHRPENSVVQVFGRQDLPRIYFRNKQEQHYEWMRPLYAREV